MVRRLAPQLPPKEDLMTLIDLMRGASACRLTKTETARRGTSTRPWTRPFAWLVLGLAVTTAACAGRDGGQPPVTEGNARFSVITPTLIRLEYAEDGAFENRPTQTVGTRPARHTPYTTRVEGGERVIETEALTLRYRVDSGPFGADNLTVTLRQGAAEVVARPAWGREAPNDDQLGGWLRGLDLLGTSAPLNPGVLSRRGWSLLDDSETALLVTSRPGYVARPERTGSYQDGYFFGYGNDYRRALADLRALTGAAPLLPRKAFGVWFSRYWPYSAAEWQGVVGEFRANAVPLDTLSLDTEWKETPEGSDCSLVNSQSGAPEGAPCSWNGWDWNTSLFPDPEGFLAWAEAEGVEVGLNIHPSINQDDPARPTFGAAAEGLRPDVSCTILQGDTDSRCLVFDLADPDQLDAYFELHRPIAEGGVDFWWFDWCCEGTRVSVPGLTADTFLNEAYAAEHRRMGSRWPAFSRIGSARGSWGPRPEAGEGLVGQGAFAEHRASLHFTGDTCSTWELIRFAAEFTAAEGAGVGMPYVSHDIGSFHGLREAGEGCNIAPFTPVLPDDMYVRWVQLGVFQPLLRLHSQHGQRLPWEYTGEAAVVAADFLRLRERLVPYLYTLARAAHDTGLPMVRALYLQWPEQEDAYAVDANFTLGDGLFVATVAAPGPAPTMEFWLPPGQWYDFWSGAPVTGGTTIVRDVALADYPVYARAGTILPTQPDLLTSSTGPQDELTLHVWAGADGAFDLYEDDGSGFDYERGRFQFTPVRYTEGEGCTEVVIGPASGRTFTGALSSRSWHVRVVGVTEPTRVRVGSMDAPRDGTTLGYTYDASTQTLTVHTGSHVTASELRVQVGAGCE
jgi:alpha-glucosidase (family GH31 glycosyl hydrolase)